MTAPTRSSTSRRGVLRRTLVLSFALLPGTLSVPRVGTKPPALSAARWYNTAAPLTLEGLAGKVVLLDFWGVWCSPCRKEMPRLAALDREFGTRGLVILTIHTPEKADLIPDFLQRNGLRLIVAVDTGETARAYGVDEYPTYFLIDATGHVVSIPDHLPGRDDIERLLAASPPASAATPAPYHAGRPLPQPALFGEGIVSTGEFETHPAFTPDGRTLYFVRSTPAFTDWKIYVTEYKGGRWSTPKMAPFSGKHRDADPFVTPDGRRLYFISDRPVDGTPKEDMDIWMMERTPSGDWGEPRNLGAPVNSTGSEWLPRPAASGTLYFGSDRPGGLGRTDLYRARSQGPGFAEPENLGPAINSAADEYEPCIAPDESYLVFMAAGRPDDLGGGDLYISRRQEDGRLSQAKNLGPGVNGPGLDIAPYLSPDGRYFFYASARKASVPTSGERPKGPRNGLGDIYQMDLPALHALTR